MQIWYGRGRMRQDLKTSPRGSSDEAGQGSARTLVGYARSPANDQLLEIQLQALSAAGCRRLYVDLETLAGQLHQLDLAISELEKGDTLVIWRLDRLAPSLRQLTRRISELTERGFSLRTLVEDIDTGSALGSIYLRVFAAIDDFERAVITEKTIVGQRQALTQGRRAGRRPKFTAEDVKAALALLDDPAMSVERAAAQSGIGKSTLVSRPKADGREANLSGGGR